MSFIQKYRCMNIFIAPWIFLPSVIDCLSAFQSLS